MSFTYTGSPDTATLAAAADAARERPADAYFNDDRLYDTHAPVISWATRGDDYLAESNFATILAHLSAVAGAADTDVLETSMRHWAVGELRQVFVRVHDERTGVFTPAWRHAVAIGIYLRDVYPAFDEQHYCDLQFEGWQANATSELAYITGHWSGIDGDERADAIANTALGELAQEWPDWSRDVCEDELEQAYLRVRDEFYTDLGHEHLVAQIPGQLELAL